MSLGWITLGWVGVSLWLVIVNVMTRRFAAGELDQLRRGGPLWVTLFDAALITLFGALWFASLGTGAWWLVFGLLGLVADLPMRILTVESRKRRPERREGSKVESQMSRVENQESHQAGVPDELERAPAQSLDFRLSTFDLARGTLLSITRFLGAGLILSLVL